MFSITEQTATLAHINVRTERHGEEPAGAAPGVSTVEDEQDAPIALDRLADYIADNWPDKKYGLEEICQRLNATWPGAFMPAAPAAGDALDAARWRWILSHAENVGFDYRSGRFTTLTVSGRQGDSLVAFVDAAIAAQRKGDA